MSDVYFIIDEAASLGPLECINDATQLFRGYSIHLALFYQSLGQSDAIVRIKLFRFAGYTLKISVHDRSLRNSRVFSSASV